MASLMTCLGRVAVLYHYPCVDGAFAALAAHLYHSALNIPAVFFPNTVYRPLRMKDFGKWAFDDFYLLDFVGPKGFALELCSTARKVVILDHHKTALERLPKESEGLSNLTKILDTNRSGATIALDYFTEQLYLNRGCKPSSMSTGGQPCERVSLIPDSDLPRVQTLFNYVEDGDLWKWALPNSRAFSSGLKDLRLKYNVTHNPKLFEQLLALDSADLIVKGERSLSANKRHIDAAIETSFKLKLGGGKFGDCLAYGGGGHCTASSFMISKQEFEDWRK